jgi:hypothetical protein
MIDYEGNRKKIKLPNWLSITQKVTQMVLQCFYYTVGERPGRIGNRLLNTFRTIGISLLLILEDAGGLEHSPQGNYAINDFIDDIDRFLQGIIVGPVVIIGHSLGAIVALKLAAQYFVDLDIAHQEEIIARTENKVV